MNQTFLDSSHIHEVGITDDGRTGLLLKNGDQIIVESSTIEIGKTTTIIQRFD